jgi:hypothetical protein
MLLARLAQRHGELQRLFEPTTAADHLDVDASAWEPDADASAAAGGGGDMPYTVEGEGEREQLLGSELNPEAAEFEWDAMDSLDAITEEDGGYVSGEHVTGGPMHEPVPGMLREYSQFDDETIVHEGTRLASGEMLAADFATMSHSPYRSPARDDVAPPMVEHYSPGQHEMQEEEFDTDNHEFVEPVSERDPVDGFAMNFEDGLEYDIHYMMSAQEFFFNDARLSHHYPDDWEEINLVMLDHVTESSYSFVDSLRLADEPVAPVDDHRIDFAVSDTRELIGGGSGGGGGLRPRASADLGAGPGGALRPSGPTGPKMPSGYDAGLIVQRSSTEKLLRKVRQVLNKVTLETFDLLKGRMIKAIEETVTSIETLQLVIDELLNKAYEDPTYAPHYADLCKCLKFDLQEMVNDLIAEDKSAMADGDLDGKAKFRRMILKSLQAAEVEWRAKVHEDIGSMDEFSDLKEAQQTDEILGRKQRFLGVITMIGQLSNTKVISDSLVRNVVDEWVARGEGLDIEAFSKLMHICGERLFRKFPDQIEEWVSAINVHGRREETRLRFMAEALVADIQFWRKRAGPSSRSSRSSSARAERSPKAEMSPSKLLDQELEQKLRAHCEAPADTTVAEMLFGFISKEKGHLSPQHWANASKHVLCAVKSTSLMRVTQFFNRCAREGLLSTGFFKQVLLEWSNEWRDDVSELPRLPQCYGDIAVNVCMFVKGAGETSLAELSAVFFDNAAKSVDLSKTSLERKYQKGLVFKYILGVIEGLENADSEVKDAKATLKTLGFRDRINEKFLPDTDMEEHFASL